MRRRRVRGGACGEQRSVALRGRNLGHQTQPLPQPRRLLGLRGGGGAQLGGHVAQLVRRRLRGGQAEAQLCGLVRRERKLPA